MFQDEAGFGRINKPKYCWCRKGIRPSVPCHHIREYRYAYGAEEPLTGNGYFLVMPYCNTACMSIFLKQRLRNIGMILFFFAATVQHGTSPPGWSCRIIPFYSIFLRTHLK